MEKDFKSMEIKLSIIIPCYGVETYLDRCMKSIVNQTIKDIEIILVDDGSPDRVPEICDRWATKDPRIKVIHKKNGGLGFARNSGLEVATGEYVAFVDSDDYVDKKMYETLWHEAKCSDADVILCGFKTEQRNGIWVNSNEVSEKTEWNGDDVKEFLLDMLSCAPHVAEERKYQMSVWHGIYRRSVIESERLQFHSEREVVSEDILFHVDFLLHATKVVYLPKHFYYYSLNNTSLTATFKPQKYDGLKKLYQLLNCKLEGVTDYRLRTGRFFIGYVRSFLLQLFATQYNNKKELTLKICNDPIWHTIRKDYSSSYLPTYPRIIYLLTIWKKYHTLKTSCLVANYMKKLRGLRGGGVKKGKTRSFYRTCNASTIMFQR